MPTPKKLIEVTLPLEKINEASAKEKSIRHGHPSTLHLWWARRPLAAARAVVWASLVDDPSSHPELFPTEEAQNAERRRLDNLLSHLVKWENSNNEKILAEARAEIKKYMGEGPLVFLDPFAGGGSIPLEAQRLGLEAHAHDLNPVAVMINKAMIEIPPRFAGQAPVNPEARRRLGSDRSWHGATGLAEDVCYYGEWMKNEAFRRIGHLYPKVQVPREQGGGEATVIAWIWARTVKCPNPACGCEMPLARSFVLSRKKGKEAWVEPHFENGKARYEVHHSGKPTLEESVNRTGAICPCCKSPVGFPYIRDEGQRGRMSAQLMAVVAEGKGGRIYLSPDARQISIAQCPIPEDCPESFLPPQALGFRVQLYGMDMHKKLFTPRQLTALTTFSDLVAEAQQKATQDALAAGLADNGLPLADGGRGALAYGQAVGVYLAFAVDRQANYSSTINTWSGEFIVQTFGRQAIPMVWDYAETNMFSNATGNWSGAITWIVKCIQNLLMTTGGISCQNAVQNKYDLEHIIISTDPPYYDNIGYADLSDFFYVWMRRILKNTYPKLFQTMLVPKAEELVATPYRFGGSRKRAKDFFEKGMLQACQQLYRCAREDVPVTIYYAYKQREREREREREKALMM